MRPRIPVMERIMAKVAIDENGCWRWMGYINELGYAKVSFEGQAVSAHRIVYTHLIGPIPIGLEIDHICNVRDCLNPEHLRTVTHAENVRRAFPPLTEFRCGHPATAANTVRDSVSGYGRCAICRRDQARRATAAYRAKR
jgi:HNH endonuclease